MAALGWDEDFVTSFRLDRDMQIILLRVSYAWRELHSRPTLEQPQGRSDLHQQASEMCRYNSQLPERARDYEANFTRFYEEYLGYGIFRWRTTKMREYLRERHGNQAALAEYFRKKRAESRHYQFDRDPM